MQGIHSSDSVRINEVLTIVGASSKAIALFEKSKVVSDKEILTVRKVYERFLVDYNIIHEEREYVGYYTVMIAKRRIYGMNPATYDELVFAMVYLAMIVFADTFVSKVLDWIELSGEYMNDIDKTSYTISLGKVRDVLQGRLA